MGMPSLAPIRFIDFSVGGTLIPNECQLLIQFVDFDLILLTEFVTLGSQRTFSVFGNFTDYTLALSGTITQDSVGNYFVQSTFEFNDLATGDRVVTPINEQLTCSP